MFARCLLFPVTIRRRVRVVINFVKKNTWIVLVAAFVVLVVAGIMVS